MNSTLHVWNVKGNLQTNKGILLFKVPVEDIRYNLWQISIYEIVVQVKDNKKNTLNKAVALSCNFVKDTSYNDVNELSTINPHLNFFLLKSLQANEKFSIFRFEKTWFYLNNYEEFFKLYFFDTRNNTKCEENVDVEVIIHLQRVK